MNEPLITLLLGILIGIVLFLIAMSLLTMV